MIGSNSKQQTSQPNNQQSQQSSGTKRQNSHDNISNDQNKKLKK